MPSLLEVQAGQPRKIGGKRKPVEGTAKKYKRAKMDKLLLDTVKIPKQSTFSGDAFTLMPLQGSGRRYSKAS